MIFLVQRAVYIHAKMHCLYMGDLIDLLHIMKVVVLNGGSELTKPDLGPATQSPGHTESAWGGSNGQVMVSTCQFPVMQIRIFRC